MRPAFSSNRQASAFAALLLVIFLLPGLMGKNQLPAREQVYSAVPWSFGAFPYLHDQIFEEPGDIDITFMGSSSIWWGVDTPYVEAQLSKALGRKAVVRSLCWNWPGFDPLYFIAKDLLEKRKVKMIVFCDLSRGAAPTAHYTAAQWFRVGDHWGDLDGLNLRTKMSFYASAIVGMPRNLLGLIRTNRPVVKSDYIAVPKAPNSINPASRLGSLAVRMRQSGNFEDFAPLASVSPSSISIYADETKTNFQFRNLKLPPTQETFTKKIGALAREHGVALVYLHFPRSTELHAPVIEEDIFWPDAFAADVKMMGIPPKKLFQDIPDSDVQKLYGDFQHLNESGQRFFAPIITPKLIELYEKQTKR